MSNNATARAIKTVHHYVFEVGGGDKHDDQTTLTDLLADLRHFAEAVGVDFARAVEWSEIHHAAEQPEPGQYGYEAEDGDESDDEKERHA